MSGTFGYELDITKIPEEDRNQIPGQVALYKKYSDLVRNGDYYRIASYRENNEYDCWMSVSKDKKNALVTFVHKYPNDVHAHEAKVMIDSLDWITAKRQDTEESYTTYMEHHSNGNYYYDAHNALRRLRDEREEAERRMQAMSDTIDAYFENEEY